ncbi:hypothetical protein ACFX5Q_21770 [Mesorhizobium sp. IMUNJ 23033]|uniref:hypothetical protein n=1 Tax=Mesorhizobium sp. IMUNJ 23033 TaxID=3378039 RepID=UPI00385105B5
MQLPDSLAQRFRPLGAFLERASRHDDGEFLAAIARHDIAVPGVLATRGGLKRSSLFVSGNEISAGWRGAFP